MAFTHHQKESTCSLHSVQDSRKLGRLPGARLYLQQGPGGVECIKAEDCPELSKRSPASCSKMQCLYCDNAYLQVAHLTDLCFPYNQQLFNSRTTLMIMGLASSADNFGL